MKITAIRFLILFYSKATEICDSLVVSISKVDTFSEPLEPKGCAKIDSARRETYHRNRIQKSVEVGERLPSQSRVSCAESAVIGFNRHDVETVDMMTEIKT